MLALADYYRKADPAQATKLYNQVKQEFRPLPRKRIRVWNCSTPKS